MARLVRLRTTCTHGEACPALYYQPDSDEFLIQGYIVTDLQLLAELRLPLGHSAVRVPTYLLPELQLDPDARELLVPGREVSEVELLTELNLPAGEAVVRVPASVLPQLRKEPQPC